MKYTFLILTSAFIFLSCKKENCEHTDSTFERIHQGWLSGNGDENIKSDNFVIKTDTEWDELLDKMNPNYDVTSNFLIPTVDFSQKMVIACFDKVRSNGGHTISVTSIVYEGGKIKVDVDKTSPGANDFSTTVVTQPYDLVMIDKCNSKVVFR